MSERKSCLVTVTKEFEIEAVGKNKKEAYGTAFAKLKKLAYASVDGLLLHMEPEDVILLKEVEKTKTEKFLGYFAPKEIQNYTIRIIVVTKIKYVPN